jgi:PKD repeat protein
MALTLRSTLIVAAALLVGACTTKKTEPPDLSGPSELSTSLAITASPDTLTQDGQSLSTIVVTARNANGQPLPNLSLRADIAVNGVVTDFGELSAKNLATDSNGTATFTYRAPEAVDSADRNTLVTIKVTPQSGDARGDIPRTIQIRLVPKGTVSGGLTQVPDFTVSPSAPKQLESVVFDASDPQLDATLVGYAWDFGDGSTGSGRTATHEYRDAGTFSATLTVTDVGGSKGSRSKTVAVGTSGNPVAAFVFSPSEPGIGEEITFNGAPSTAVSPRTIVKYDWQFGTDRSGSGMIVTKKYDTPGTYNVSLTVTDDAGNKGTTTQGVTVGTSSPGGLSAAFSVSPSDPAPNTDVSFNAAISTSADPIVSYKWDYGDTHGETKTVPTASHQYTTEGTFTVTLTVTDSKGRTATTSQPVEVATAGP